MNGFEKELKKNGLRLKTIPSKERTEQMCAIAVRQNPRAIKFVPASMQTEKLCKQALKKDPTVIKMLSRRALTDKVRLYAVKQDGRNLAYLKESDISEKVYRTALENTVEALRFIPRNIKNLICPSAEDTLVKDCLEWIKKDITASYDLPDCIRASLPILSYQKEQGYINILSSSYDSEQCAFQVNIECIVNLNNGYSLKYKTFISLAQSQNLWDFGFRT